MEFDKILAEYVGQIGPYQIFVLIFACSVGIQTGLNNIDFSFIAAVPDYRCDIGNTSQLSESLSFEELTRLSSPELEGGKYDSCLVYDRNYSLLTVDQVLNEFNSSSLGNGSTFPTNECERWIYSQDVFTNTVVSQFNLVCDKEWLVAFSQSIAMAGYFTIIVGGWLCDRVGRKRVALGCFGVHVISRLTCALSPNYYVFIVSRFFMVAATANWYTVCFILAVEIVGPRWRVFAGQIPYVFWSIGYMIVPGMAYLIREWSTLTLVMLVFAIPYVLHFWFLPESIRWLQSNDKHEEAAILIKQMAKFNRKELPDKALMYEKTETTSPVQKAGWRDLFKTISLVKNTVILSYIWFATTLVYFGLVFYLPNLGGNIFLNTFISGALEIPAIVYVQLTLDTKLGRRLNTVITMIVSSCALFALIAVPTELKWLTLVLALLGRFSITAVFSTIYVFTSEIYPTGLRGLALSTCSTMARIGGVLAPNIALMGNVVPVLPPVTFGTLSLVAGILALLLPETRGKELTDTIVEVDVSQNEDEENPSDDIKLESLLQDTDCQL